MSGPPQRRWFTRAHAAAAVLTMIFGSAAGADIIGDVVRVGYGVTNGSVVRSGAWVPIVVDLQLQKQVSFDGLLRLRQFDRDGDIYVDQVPVHLSDTGAGAQQRYWLYTIASPRNDRTNSFEVELLATETGDDSDATLVQVISGGVPVPAMVPPFRPESLSDDVYLILEISDVALGKIRNLLDPKIVSEFDRPLAIAHGSPADLPSQWVGLEMVDCVVWEDADPTLLTPAQLQALIAWVEHGGRLVLAAGRTSDAVAQSAVLGPLLPVRVGQVGSAREMPAVRRHLLGLGGEADAGYARPVVFANCALAGDQSARQIVFEPALDSTMVAARNVGRGRLVFIAATIANLLDDPQADVRAFFQPLLELRTSAITDETANVTYVNLFRFLDREVGFYETGSLRLGLAILFAVAYVLLATLGAWKVLQSRDQLKQSWTALAVVAVIASILSLVGVQIVHGVGTDVRQMSVVDAKANQAAARATAYFGVKTATHSRLDFWLPSDYRLETEPAATGCTLEPMLEPMESIERAMGFTDPGRYWLLPSTAEAHDVPIRATLKQFEGRWRGDLRGTLLSSVVAADVELLIPGELETSVVRVRGVTEDSWIENDLGVDLHDCQLYFADDSTFAPPNFPIKDQRSGTSRESQRMHVFQLGTIAAGERINLYEKLFKGPDGKTIAAERHAEQGLNTVARIWGQSFIRLGEVVGFRGEEVELDYSLVHYQYVLLLMSVMADINPAVYGIQMVQGLRVFSKMRMRHLDLADAIQQDTALFVGFASDAGPARLCIRAHGRTRYEPHEPGLARTMYRILIPIEPGGPKR